MGCTQLSVCDEATVLNIHATQPSCFSFSAYTQEELTVKAHNYELETCGDTVLCLDAKQRGIGSSGCGPEVPKDRQVCAEDLHFTLYLKPENK